jgi:phage tail protein X
MWEGSRVTSEIIGTVITDDGTERLDQFVGRLYGRTLGTVEAVLEANPGLAALGAYPPAGTRIALPRVEDEPGDAGAIKPWD